MPLVGEIQEALLQKRLGHWPGNETR